MLRHSLTAVGMFAMLIGSRPVSAADKDAAAEKSGVQISQLSDRLRIELNGQLFTEYFFTNAPKPYFYPLIGPGGARMTRNWPMQNPPGEEHDHPHHRSLWLGHIEV